jgi:sugar phosphate permease
MLIGLSGAELVSPGAVGASQGILGWIAYLGAANAGAVKFLSAGRLVAAACVTSDVIK